MAVVKLFCVLAVLIQAISSQCIGNPYNPGFNFNGYGPNYPNNPGPGLANPASSGGGFAVTSTSPIAPTGVSVLAENLAIEGPLSVGGQLPFLGSVGIEGTLPAYGAGAVSYGCGNGNVAINNEGPLGLAPGPYGQVGQPFGQVGQAFGPNLANGLANGYGPGQAYGQGIGPGFGFNGFGPLK